MSLYYVTGQEVRNGDVVRYLGEDGSVDFVVSAPTGDPSIDWHLKECPAGGIMLLVPSFGRVFLQGGHGLELISRPKSGREG